MFRNIPTITRYLLGVNIVLFLLTYLAKGAGMQLNSWLGLHFILASDFNILQLFTYMFMHANFEHVFFNMFALWMFAGVIENTWGAKRFLIYYIVCGIGAGLFQEVAQLVNFYIICDENIPGFSFGQLMEAARANNAALNQWTTVGASGAVYAILLAFGMTYPEERMFIFPLPVPIKAKWFVIGYAVLEVSLALMQPGDNVAHLAHLGGMVVGFMLFRMWKKHPDWLMNFDLADYLRRKRWQKQTKGGYQKFTHTTRHVDHEYNQRKKQEQQEIDQILDKVRRSGYDALTREEKQKLFDMSKK